MATREKSDKDPSQVLARFAATLSFSSVPPAVIRRTEELFLDWFASALAGKGARPVETITSFVRSMGPIDGPSELLIHRQGSSPLVATFANAAASHFAEQDDIHNGSVFHPGTVTFPPVLAVAQALGKTGQQFLTACVVGYEVGIRVGEFLGRSHYKVFHTTATAGTLAAAAATGRLLELTPDTMRHAFGTAGTQAAGLWEFLRDGADSKQLHAAHAASAGLTSAYLARDGFKGARRIFDGPQGLAAAMSADSDAGRLTAGLGNRWALGETSFKLHASCRHTHPAADALLQIMQTQSIGVEDVASVIALVHQAAIDVLGAVQDPQTPHQAKFSMGTVLGIIAVYGRAGLVEFDEHFQDPAVVAFRKRVCMVLDEEVEAAYPARWIGKVVVETVRGERYTNCVLDPKGDPSNTLSRTEIEGKAVRLAQYRSGATASEMRTIIDRIWQLSSAPRIAPFLTSASL